MSIIVNDPLTKMTFGYLITVNVTVIAASHHVYTIICFLFMFFAAKLNAIVDKILATKYYLYYYVRVYQETDLLII